MNIDWDDCPEDQGTTTWGYTLAKALGISGLYGYDEAAEMEREAAAYLEETR